MKGKSNIPLVSIITPCYNGEKYIQLFLNSVLSQSYRNIELIVINDGSTDKTEEIILSNKKEFQKKGIELICIFQENKGQAAALNKGLKVFKGEYLTWPDSDDILHEDNVKERVEFLENNKEYNVVLCESRVVDKYNSTIGILKRKLKENRDNLFYDLIVQKNTYYAGGAYMFRSNTFIQEVPSRQIYESRGGQNWQMLLPVLYNNKCGYLHKKLYIIYAREGSHSRQRKNLVERINRCDEHEDILLNTVIKIDSMPNEEKDFYLELIKRKYAHKRLLISAQFSNVELMNTYYKILKDNGYVKINDKIIYLKGRYMIIKIMYAFFRIPWICARKLNKMKLLYEGYIN